MNRLCKLTVLLMLCLGVFLVPAQAIETEQYAPMELDTDYAVSLTQDMRVARFAFTPTETGYYKFSAIGASELGATFCPTDENGLVFSYTPFNRFPTAIYLTAGQNCYVGVEAEIYGNLTVRVEETDGYLCGENLTWVFDDGRLVVSGEGEMGNYQYGGSPWNMYGYGAQATSIIIKDGVTSIGNEAFTSCLALRDVSIADSVTRIGTKAFRRSTMPSIVLPKALKTIESSAFLDCANLAEVTFKGNAPTISADAFKGCTATVYYPGNLGTWTEDVMQQYGGTLTWVPYGEVPTVLDSVEVYDVLGHTTGNILYWNAVENADLYQVFRLNNGKWELLSNTRGLAYKDTTALPGVKHYYKIVARNGDSKSDIKTTASVSVTRPVVVTTLANVTITSINAHTSGNILYWNAVENADLYQVYRLNGSSWELLTNTRSLGYKDTDVEDGKTYYYKIVARNGDIKSNIATTTSTGVKRATAAVTTLANVTISQTIGHSTGNILYWNAVENADLYQVFRLNNGKWELLTNTRGLGYKDTTAPAGVKSYYKIVARNGDLMSSISTTSSTGVVRAV